MRIKEGELNAIGAHSIQETVVDNLVDYWNKWQRNNVHSIQEAGADNLIDCESETYGNRVHYYLVTSPAGRPLHEYQLVRELLEVLRDCMEKGLMPHSLGQVVLNDQEPALFVIN